MPESLAPTLPETKSTGQISAGKNNPFKNPQKKSSIFKTPKNMHAGFLDPESVDLTALSVKPKNTLDLVSVDDAKDKKPELTVHNPDNLKSNVDLTKLDPNEVNLSVISKEGKRRVVTVEDAKEIKRKKTLENLRNLGMTATTLAGGLLSTLTGVLEASLSSKNPVVKALGDLNDVTTTKTFSIFGAFGSSDAHRRKYLPQLVAQALAVVVPLFGNPDDLTMLRRPEVGLANIAADIEKLGNGKKEGYETYAEGLEVVKRAVKNYMKSMKANPSKAFTDFESGVGGINAGLMTGFSLLPYLAGYKKAGSVLGQIFGILVEFLSKFNMDNLRHGRYALFASGGLMAGSSFLNMVKLFLPESLHKATENLTWGVNLVGKQAQLQAYNNGEMALKEKKEINWLALPVQMLQATLGKTPDVINSTQETEPVIGTTNMSPEPAVTDNSSGEPVIGTANVFRRRIPTRSYSNRSGSSGSSLPSSIAPSAKASPARQTSPNKASTSSAKQKTQRQATAKKAPAQKSQGKVAFKEITIKKSPITSKPSPVAKSRPPIKPPTSTAKPRVRSTPTRRKTRVA